MGKNAPDPSDLPIKVILKIWVSRKKVLVDSTIFDKVQKKKPAFELYWVSLPCHNSLFINIVELINSN